MEKTDDDESEHASEVETEDGADDSENKEENTGDQKEQDEEKDDDDKKKVEADEEAELSAPAKKKAGLNMGGVAIAILGVLGMVGAVLWDPFMNILDSKHTADINIGNTQMFGVVAAVLILLVGVMIVFAMRKKTAAS